MFNSWSISDRGSLLLRGHMNVYTNVPRSTRSYSIDCIRVQLISRIHYIV